MAIMVTPASAISLISQIQTRFMVQMSRTPTMRGEARDREKGEDDNDARTEIGSPEPEPVGVDRVTLPPIHTLPPPVVSRDYVQPSISHDALQTGAVFRVVLLLYGSAGVTPAPTELANALPQEQNP
ncbi:hypothetical protein RhiJN_07324 [Ceratobasidium sp. AG-Ba]|nr:hypothetical protein RhiJN_07324 [Ceratobasidium sp. AG-Ba]QRW06776.1 hypothetical protein RhiLY_05775 [Ceratobasidium sp. AG-Ba]